MSQENAGIVEQFAPSDPLMAVAWRDCLLWASSNPDCLDRFTADTGVRYIAPRTRLDALVDEASGRNEAVALQFVEWFNANVWGAP